MFKEGKEKLAASYRCIVATDTNVVQAVSQYAEKSGGDGGGTTPRRLRRRRRCGRTGNRREAEKKAEVRENGEQERG